MDELNLINRDQNICSVKNSSFIKYQDGSSSVFRIRVVLNNGTSALLRQYRLLEPDPNKNNSSVLTLKMQVDKVKEIINKYDVNNI